MLKKIVFEIARRISGTGGTRLGEKSEKIDFFYDYANGVRSDTVVRSNLT